MPATNNRQLAKMPAYTVKANIGGERACCEDVALADFVAALGLDGGGVADGDKGDVTVASSGAAWTINASVISTYGRALTVAADAAAARAVLAAAPLASPTFTGTPAAPTASGGTNTTQIATTQFVQSAIAAVVHITADAEL